MPSKIDAIFEESVTFSVVGVPYTGAASSSNFRSDGAVVRILFTANPEVMAPPMVGVLVSNRTILGIKQTICDEEPGVESRCFGELKELLEFYFTSDFS